MCIIKQIHTPCFEYKDDLIVNCNTLFSELYEESVGKEITYFFPRFDGVFPYVGRDIDYDTILLMEIQFSNGKKYVLVSTIQPKQEHHVLFSIVKRMSPILRTINDSFTLEKREKKNIQLELIKLNQNFNLLYQKANLHQAIEHLNVLIIDRVDVDLSVIGEEVEKRIIQHKILHEMKFELSIKALKKVVHLPLFVFFSSIMTMYYILVPYIRKSNLLVLIMEDEEYIINFNFTLNHPNVKTIFNRELITMELDFLKLAEKKLDWKYSIRVLDDRIEQILSIPK